MVKKKENTEHVMSHRTCDERFLRRPRTQDMPTQDDIFAKFLAKQIHFYLFVVGTVGTAVGTVIFYVGTVGTV